MVIFFMANVDLSGQAPTQVPPGSPTPPPTGDADPDILIRRDVHDGIERRGMRLVLSFTVLFFAIVFLSYGLHFALKVGNSLLVAKSSIVTALTQTPEADTCQPSTKCTNLPENGHESAAVPPAASVLDQNRNAMSNLSTDWLSASSLIAIVAFILGVGLTLLLTLLKSAFQHPTDKNRNDKSDSNTIQLATPISELIMGIINYIKEKVSK